MKAVVAEVEQGCTLRCAKELADALGHHVDYIYAMKRDGFPMPGGVNTVYAALQWLEDHPHPRRRTSLKT